MAKAIAVVLLFAAAALVSANGSINVQLGGDKSGNGTVQASIADLHQQLQDAAKYHKGDLSGCECQKECQDQKQEFCKVETTVQEVCKDVEVQKDYIECKTKCYQADKVVEINVPTVDLSHMGRRRLFESTPVKKADGSIQITHPLGAVAGADGQGKDGGKDGQKEVCREICTPGKRPVMEQECGDVEDKKYDCKEEVVATRCKTMCKCGDKITLEIKEVPDYLGAMAKSGHPKAQLAAAALNALP